MNGSILSKLANLNERTSIRSRLLEDIEAGQIAPEEAEALAARLGVGPLLPSPPDVADYDFLGEPRWSFEVALAWIIWRDIREVVKFHNVYRKRVHSWQKNLELNWGAFEPPPDEQPSTEVKRPPPFPGKARRKLKTPPEVHVGWLPSHLGSATIYDVRREAGGSAGEHAIGRACSYDTALSELIHALRAGRLCGAGLVVDAGEMREIRSFEWELLQPEFLSTTSHSTIFMLNKRAKYRDVMVAKGNVVSIWPELAAQKKPAKARADREERWQLAAVWFEAEVQKWRDGGLRLSRDKVTQLLSAPPYLLSSTDARQLWGEKRPPEWGKPGRR